MAMGRAISASKPAMTARRIVLVAAAFLFGGNPGFAQDYPKRLVWRGTLTESSGRTGELRIQAHLVYGRDIGPEYRGRFRCRGDACPGRRGPIQAYSYGTVRFWTRGRQSTECHHFPPSFLLPTDYNVMGSYSCSTSLDGVTIVVTSVGELDLVRIRRGSNSSA
jgi:hypothetical protein